MSVPLIFFFSSRRRHTRFDCDWSSDVCSSDLAACSPMWLASSAVRLASSALMPACGTPDGDFGSAARDRKSTRLNSSHSQISYAVFCLKKKKKKQYANDVQTNICS